MLKVLFLGSHLQSYRCFKYLVNNFTNIDLIGIVPHNSPTLIREDQNILTLAKEYKIEVLKHDDICHKKFDLGISLLYDKVLDQDAISIPSKGFINFHLGPLPRLRGSNSILNAILLARKENDWTFGVTLHYIARAVDTGPIINVLNMPIFEDDTAFTLYNRASDKVYDLFVQNIQQIINSDGMVSSKEQKGKSYLFKKGAVDHYVDMSLPCEEVYDRIRALTFPGKPRPFTLIGDKKIYLTLEER